MEVVFFGLMVVVGVVEGVGDLFFGFVV